MSEEKISESVPTLTPALLRKIGQAWGGRHFQSDLARETGFDKGHITRCVKEPRDHNGRVPTVSFCKKLDRVLIDKIEDVAKVINYNGSPQAIADGFDEARELLFKAIAAFRAFTPREKRVSIAETTNRIHKPGPKPHSKRKPRTTPK